MHCNLPLWLVLKRCPFFLFHLLSMPYITEILTVFDEPVFEISWSLGKLGSSGGNHMTDNDHFTWRINNNLKAKVFFFSDVACSTCCGLLQCKRKINNILEVHISQNSCFQGFYFFFNIFFYFGGVRVGCVGWADLWRSFNSCKLQAYEMHCHPFKGMTITLVPLLLIPPPDPCHHRSTSLSLNVLHLLARAAGSFHVCEESHQYASICTWTRNWCLYLHLSFWTVYDLWHTS